MIGSFLTRGLVMILGYAYPAYECYKTVERNKPEIEQLRFWCQYWILVAVMTVFERIGDTFVSWVPMYCEAKLAFIIYLWYPKIKGTTFVYNSFFQPYISKRETEIDRNLLELRSRAGDMFFMYCQRTVSYGQIRIFEILQYVAAQSTTPRPRPTQAEQQAPKARQAPATAATSAAAPAPPPRQPSKRAEIPQPQPEAEEETLSRTSSTSSSPQENEIEMEDQQSSSQGPSTSSQVPSTSVKGPSTMAPGPPSFPRSPLKKSISMPIAPQSPRRTVTNKVETVQITTVPGKVLKSPAKPPIPPRETVMEETIRVTRGRLRKTRSTVAK